MDIDTFRSYCLSKKGAHETMPFDQVTLVMKVMDKMFALTRLDADIFSMNLKCDPDYAVELRDEYEDVQPGYHMSKRHWNTVTAHHGIPVSLLYELIDHSYDLVCSKLSKAQKQELDTL